MRKRVETFQRVLTKAKRDQEQVGTRKFKETIGGAQQEDIKEERKQEEVFTFATKWQRDIYLNNIYYMHYLVIQSLVIYFKLEFLNKIWIYILLNN